MRTKAYRLGHGCWFGVAVVCLLCVQVAWAAGMPSYRLGEAGRIDFFSSWARGGKPHIWKRLKDDQLTLTFWEVGEVISGREMVRQGKVWEGRLVRNGNAMDSRIEVTELGEGRLKYQVAYRSDHNRNPVFLALTFNPPLFGREIECFFSDGTRQVVTIAPVPHRGKFIWHKEGTNPCVGIRIPLQTGFLTLSGFRAKQVLGMKYAPAQGNLQLYLNDDCTKGALAVDLRLEGIASAPIDLKPHVNRGFADEIANDGLGGWTDEGRLNDLRGMKPGRRRMGNLEMCIIDPADNGGKSCLALGRKPGFLATVDIPLSGQFSQLNLLHACTYMTSGNAGRMCVFYADGDRQEFPMVVRRDVANWWNPVSCVNAWAVWHGSNDLCGDVGVFLSRFKLRGKRLSHVRLTASERDVRWLILAMSGVREGMTAFPQPTREIPFASKADATWREFKVRRPVAGTVMDFSFLQEAPAGQHGRVVIRDGRFEFENRPGKQARFYGVNLANGACFLTDEQLAYYVTQIRRAGFNAVRIHNFDFKLLKPGTEMSLDSRRLDTIHRMFAACKKAGLYVTLDLFVTPAGGYPDLHGRQNTFEMMKAQCLLDDAYRMRLKEYAKRLLLSHNPHTGMSLARDPALIAVSFINENSSFFSWAAINSTHPVIGTKVRSRFERWCKERGQAGNLEDIQDYSRFLTDMHKDLYQDLRRFMGELGMKVPTTDMNNGCVLMQYPVRREFDYVDDHFYIDHPRYPNGNWTSPLEFANKSTGSNFYAQVIHPFASRIAGKPLTMTEFRYCAPNQWRLEGGCLIGALGGLHGVDGLFDFSLHVSHGDRGLLDEGDYLMDQFGTFRDPVNDVGSRITALLYLRGDMPAANRDFQLSVPSDMTRHEGALTWRTPNGRLRQERLPEAFQRLALLGRTSIVFDQKEGDRCFELAKLDPGRPNQLLERVSVDPAGELVSENGCLRLFPSKNRTVVVTPRTEAMSVLEERAAGTCLSVEGNSCFSTYAASAMDGRPLSHSGHVLVFHMTDVTSGQGADFRTYGKSIRVYKWGRHPFLLRKAQARISLVSSAEGSLVIYAIDMSGRRMRQVDYQESGGRVSFVVDNTVDEYPAIGYELVRR